MYNNYEGIFSMEEIDKLLFELQEEHVSLTQKTPSMIRQNHDIVERKKEEMKFNWLNELYIRPLLEFSKRDALNRGMSFYDSYSSSDYSIMERMVRLRNELVSKGYHPQTITQLVPKNVDEVNTLLQANKQGFDLGFDNIPNLSNEDRVERANKYLLIKNSITFNKEADDIGKTI